MVVLASNLITAGFIIDGDRGDITVSGSGGTWTIDNGVVTTAKLATLAPGVIISGSSTDDALRITQTGAGNAIIVEDDNNPDATRFAISANGDVGIGTAPVNNVGFTGVRVSGSTGGLIDFLTGAQGHGRIFNSSTAFIVEAGFSGAAATTPLVFRTNISTERFRITAEGAWGLAGPTNTGTAGQLITSNGSASAPTWQTITLENIPDAWTKRSCRVATTANITLSAPQTIDGIAVIAGDRVLVKNQTLPADNGIYVVAAAAWSRSADANLASELGAATVGIDSGTVNGGLSFDTDFKSTDTLGTTAMSWFVVLDANRLITAGSTSTASIVNYNGTTAAAGQFDGGTTTPTGTTRLNYGGNLYPTSLNLVGTADTATAASHYLIEIGSDGFVRPKTLANVQAEIVTSAVLGTGTANNTTYLRGDRTWATVASGGTTAGQAIILSMIFG